MMMMMMMILRDSSRPRNWNLKSLTVVSKERALSVFLFKSFRAYFSGSEFGRMLKYISTLKYFYSSNKKIHFVCPDNQIAGKELSILIGIRIVLFHVVSLIFHKVHGMRFNGLSPLLGFLFSAT